METEIISGPNMAFVGILTVFLALSLIVGVVTVIARLLATDSAAVPQAAKAPADTAIAVAADSGNSERLLRIALAAYAYHLGRATVVRQHVAPSPWLRAGRQQAVSRLHSKG